MPHKGNCLWPDHHRARVDASRPGASPLIPSSPRFPYQGRSLASARQIVCHCTDCRQTSGSAFSTFSTEEGRHDHQCSFFQLVHGLNLAFYPLAALHATDGHAGAVHHARLRHAGPPDWNFPDFEIKYTLSGNRNLRKIREVPSLDGLRVAVGNGEMCDGAAAVAAENTGN
ncbi:hypothetical protein B0H11DRAFT_2419470 [Mycena galericulata]|nr:hypothetical protein B0H11DRAFT_2419470 [Mycena galericulata]